MFQLRAVREGAPDIRDLLLPAAGRRRPKLCFQAFREPAILPRQIGEPIAHSALAFRPSHLIETRRLLAIAQRPLSFGPCRLIIPGVRPPPAVCHNPVPRISPGVNTAFGDEFPPQPFDAIIHETVNDPK